jgi:signal transduction histidine kinase
VAHRRRLSPLIHSHHLPRSARSRLTALYCCLFFPSGVVLVVITYVLIVVVQHPVNQAVLRQVSHFQKTPIQGGSISGGSSPPPHGFSTGGSIDIATVTLPGHIILGGSDLVIGSCIVLVALIGISVLLGWFAAGRVLRPLRVMTTTTRQISEQNLHKRLALAGPNDELKDLGDTIDELLARLEAAFDSQRRFVANASHELRTQLMLSQTILQVALADPGINLDSLRGACEEAIGAGKDQAQLIEALLTLARSQRGLEHRELVDLQALVDEALNAYEPSASARGLQINAALGDAEVFGDARLMSRLVSNLIDNAIRYNVTGGLVEVSLVASATEATLVVSNTGPPVPANEIDRLLEPFQRAESDRTAGASGIGLGLSIVAQIAEAHGASLEVLSRPGGGLNIAVSLPTGGAQPTT